MASGWVMEEIRILWKIAAFMYISILLWHIFINKRCVWTDKFYSVRITDTDSSLLTLFLSTIVVVTTTTFQVNIFVHIEYFLYILCLFLSFFPMLIEKSYLHSW